MFYTSNKEKPYFYRAQRVKKGVTAKGDHYTFISISHKDKQDSDKWKNATLYVWDDVDIKEGDSVAFYNITGVNYKETESGFKKYIDLAISTSKVKVKSADEKPAAKSENTNNNTASPANTAPSYSSAVQNSDFEEVGDEDDLPF